ncbi:MAG: pitrilysin family protein, partial [Myxococcota bacterium]
MRAALVALLFVACAEKAPPPKPAPTPEAAPMPVKIMPSAKTPKGVSLPDYKTVSFENGLKLILLEKREVPLVAFHARIAGGALADPADKAGTGSLLAELMSKGAGNRDAKSFAEAIDAVGGEFDISVGLESLELSGEFLSRNQDLMLELLADSLRKPRLAKSEFEKIRTRAVQSIAAAKDQSPQGLIGYYGRAFVYGDHPYGRAVDGSERSLGQVTYGDVKAYFRDQLGADRTTLVVVGDFDSGAMEEAVRARLGDW